MQLLSRTPDFAVGVGSVAIAVASVAAVALLLGSMPRLRASVGRGAAVAVALGLAAALLAPAAYAVATVQTACSSGDPNPGPGATSSGFGGGGGPGGFAGDGARPAFAGTPPAGSPPTVPSGAMLSGTPPTALPGSPSGGGGMNAAADSALMRYLVANRGSATWIVAATSAGEAGPIQLATGLPVMAVGGFTGSDPAPTLEQLKGYVASGQVRFVLAGGGNGGRAGGDGTASARTAWVTGACTLVTTVDPARALSTTAPAPPDTPMAHRAAPVGPRGSTSRLMPEERSAGRAEGAPRRRVASPGDGPPDQRLALSGLLSLLWT